MSMGVEARLDIYFNGLEQEALCQAGRWRSNNGYIHISAMSDQHIKNCIRRLEQSRAESLWIPKFLHELKKRGIYED